ncbi:uncharacterized protein LOC117602398 isoform X1 [Osmia lignaria lignaria]|uniref:uncharacterized protein LOC117602398 isoform X1 n=1 Tax=Osmia lignaria lignaria TaxID=1437193 RepID=UPI001478255B|nr:uncharacterized protein LOC117602398 isoform X1 [Osmia lignaria]
MKVLVVCTLMLHHLQIAEPIARHQWQQQPRDRFQFERPMESVDEIPRPLDRSRLKEDNAMLLLDRPTPVQRKQIVTDYQELESPERIHVQTRVPTFTKYPIALTMILIAVCVCSQSSCSCESQYEMIDLGDGHYPRYLPVSRCKPKTCQSKFHSCKALPYIVRFPAVRYFPLTIYVYTIQPFLPQVYVLRSREMITPPKDDEKIPETPLPEPLQHKWQLKPMTISVACVLA